MLLGEGTAIRDLNSPGNSINQNDYSRILGNELIERAVKDIRRCMKHDIKHNVYSYVNKDKNDPVKTSSIAYFFSSPLCIMCCGTLDPWYILGRVAIEMRYPFIEELEHDYERGLEDSWLKTRHATGSRSRATCTGETATINPDIYTRR